MNNKELSYQFASEEAITNLRIERYKLDAQIQYDVWKRHYVNKPFNCHSIPGLKLLSLEEYRKFQDEIIESLQKSI